MNFLYCYITATETEHVFLYKKPEYNDGQIHINLLGTDGKYYQVFGDASKEMLMGNTQQLFYDFELNGVGGDFGNFLTETTDIYIVNKFSGHIKEFFYNPKEKVPLNEKIEQCDFGKESLTALPEKYTPYEPIIFIEAFIIALILIWCIYFFKKSKHKK